MSSPSDNQFKRPVIIFSDVDGTLLDNKHLLHPRNKRAITFVRRNFNDIPFVIATGKQRIAVLEQLIVPLNLSGSIQLNGGITYGDDGKIVHEESLSPLLLLRLYDSFVKSKHDKGEHPTSPPPPSLFFYSEDLVYELSSDITHSQWGSMLRAYGERVISLSLTKESQSSRDDSAPFHTQQEVLEAVANKSLKIYKATICQHPGVPLEECRSLLPDGETSTLPTSRTTSSYHLTQALTFCLEILPPSSSKGNAVKRMVQSLGINLKNCLVFGDALNDLSMFKVVREGGGMAVVMGNSTDKELLEASTSKTGTNDVGGVGQFLETLFNIPASYNCE